VHGDPPTDAEVEHTDRFLAILYRNTTYAHKYTIWFHCQHRKFINICCCLDVAECKVRKKVYILNNVSANYLLNYSNTYDIVVFHV
jgi:hypothetical protein